MQWKISQAGGFQVNLQVNTVQMYKGLQRGFWVAI